MKKMKSWRTGGSKGVFRHEFISRTSFLQKKNVIESNFSLNWHVIWLSNKIKNYR